MTTREFQFTEGPSQKFWRIGLDGASTTVTYGRLGTAGQTQSKNYADAAAAQAAYNKLIAEKVKKGYSEVGTPATLATSATPPAPPPAAPRAAKAAPAPEPTPPAAPALLPTDEPVRLELAPEDYLWATWRDTPALPRPAPPPFDLAEACQRLKRIGRDVYAWSWNWERAAIAPVVSAAEAHFWLTAIGKSRNSNRITPADLAAQLATQTFDGELGFEAAHKLTQAASRYLPAITTALLTNFATSEMLISWLAGLDFPDLAHSPQGSEHWVALVDGFRRYVLPYLEPATRRQLAAPLTPHLAKVVMPVTFHASFPPMVHVAAMLGQHGPALQALVAQWADDRYTGEAWYDHYQRPQELVFGLNDPQLVEQQLRRLKLRLNKPEYVRAWLAHTEFAALDVVRDSIVTLENKDEATRLVEAFACAVGPHTAPHMLEIMHNSRAPQPARAWLEAHPGHSIAGLLPVAAGRGKLADAAADMLRRLARRGYADAIAAALPTLGDEGATRLQASVLDAALETRPPLDEAAAPDELRLALAEERAAKRPRLPSWLRPADLSPVVISGQVLSDAQVLLLLGGLQRSKLDSPMPLVAAVRHHAEVGSRETFAWELFQQWLAEGAPSKENWAMLALGMLGADATALKLAPLVRAWPGESQHQRAVTGLECLRAIGNDTALMQINGIAQKVKFKALQARASECMELIAKQRGLSRAELEDRIVPDCDLDERGERVFDFGPRQFRFALGPDLKPVVRDEQGKIKPDLPKPSAKDDEARAAQAVADWKLLKKQIAEAAKVQALRLEQAMVVGRRWPRETFELLIARHPLMTHLARPLVWGAYDGEGKIAATFRVTEDQSYANSADELFDLAPFASVGLVHRLHMAEQEQAAWGELLSDYELVPPFPQLGRATYQPEPDERGKHAITRFNHLSIPTASLVFGLDKLGWQRDAPADGGGFSGHFKPFYQANITAAVQYEEGVSVGYIVDAPSQQLKYLVFVPGIRQPEWWPDHDDRLPLSSVDPVVISEVLNDLMTVMAKAS
ncbi:MAG: DUF4132 domain-containing protein [Chloroflexaceae bacterium]|nr:DUF4132 domain-containing protein [Chloroflexaceae bacterium]